VVRLHNVQDSNGRFLIRLKIEDNAGQTVEALESVLKKYMSEMKQNVTINTIINNEIATVGHLIQAGNIQTGGNGQQGNAIMAKFVNKIGGDVGNLIQGDTVNVHIEPQTAKALEDIVAKTPAEKPGFTEELKSEVIGALKSIALEQARALPKNVYSLLKEFFPSYVRPFLP
jgi:molybdopterin converting factor small subunit